MYMYLLGTNMKICFSENETDRFHIDFFGIHYMMWCFTDSESSVLIYFRIWGQCFAYSLTVSHKYCCILGYVVKGFHILLTVSHWYGCVLGYVVNVLLFCWQWVIAMVTGWWTLEAWWNSPRSGTRSPSNTFVWLPHCLCKSKTHI